MRPPERSGGIHRGYDVGWGNVSSAHPPVTVVGRRRRVFLFSRFDGFDQQVRRLLCVEAVKTPLVKEGRH